VFRMSVGDGEIAQVTNVFTGVSGITALSPALSVAQRAPRGVLGVVEDLGQALDAKHDGPHARPSAPAT